MKLKVGDKAPELGVNDQDGKPVKLSEYKGKKLVLYFYPRDQTPGCTAQACNLRDNYKLLQKQGYEVLGVSTDSEKSHRNFIARQSLPFRLLADEDKKLHGRYGTWVEKSMYGRKYMGTARVTFIINEKGVIEDIVEKVDTKNHTAQIITPGGTSPGPKKVLAKPTVNNKPAKKTTSAKKPAKKSVKKKK